MIIIVDFGVGNLSSIRNMFKKAGIESKISGVKYEVERATKLVLPGMGRFDHCIGMLNQSGLRETVEKKALIEKIPVLGICVGLQMFMESSEEGNLPGLGWLSGKTIRFNEEKMKERQKVPNMGWLEVFWSKPSPLLDGLNNSRFYYAHSYHVDPKEQDVELIKTEYGYPFTAAIEKENLLGVQFHPEKSHRFGLRLLKNFATNY